RRLIFISTTGVYGDAGGEVVDENTPCDPARPGGQALLAAEQILQSGPHWSTRGTILRLAGLHGPGLLPRSADIRPRPPMPAARPGGHAFLAAEQIPQRDPHWSTRRTTPRLAGLYGPGRVPRSADIRAGQPIPAARGGALNLIHVEDAVQAVQKAADAREVSP